MLNASRLQLDTSSSWNRQLRDALEPIFVHAVDQFNRTDAKFQWPYYLPRDTTASFFKPAQKHIHRELALRPIIESFGQTMHCPNELSQVPTRYIDKSGVPFSLTDRTGSRYLSPNYPRWTIQSLVNLGVSVFSDAQFLKDLSDMMTEDPPSFRNRPDEWHSSLASALVQLTSTKSYKATLKKLSLIPLANGSWVAAESKPVFFLGDLQLDNFPVEDAISIVDPRIATDLARRSLFANLDIKIIDKVQLCTYICDAHGSPDFEPEDWTAEQLVAQVKLLYQSSFKPSEPVDLWFVTSDHKRSRGSELYFRGLFDKNSSTSRVFDRLEEKFPVLHPDYLTCDPVDNSWVSFLTDSFHLSVIPRIVASSKSKSKLKEKSKSHPVTTVG